jgi:YYY domain-containing protein
MEYGVVVRWWLLYQVLLVVGLPFAARVLPDAPDRGASLAMPTALVLLTLPLLWVGQLAFGLWVVVGVAVLLLAASAWLARGGIEVDARAYAEVVAVFTVAFLFLIAIRAAADGVHPFAGEKFLDFGILQSLLRADRLPPQDMWFAGERVIYYYGGHLMAATLSLLTGTEGRFAYSPALAGFYAMAVTGAYGLASTIAASTSDGNETEPVRGSTALAVAGVVFALALVAFGVSWYLVVFPVALAAAAVTRSRRVRAGVLAAFVFGFASNLLTPVRLLASKVGFVEDLVAAAGIREGRAPTITPGTFDSWHASRIVETGINEFPLFAYLNGDLHGHMMDVAVLFLVAGVALAYYRTPAQRTRRRIGLLFGAMPLLAATILAVNTWSFPTVLGVTALSVALADPSPHTLVPARFRGPFERGGRVGTVLQRVAFGVGAAVVVAVLSLAVVWPFVWNVLLLGAAERNPAFLPEPSQLGSFLIVHGLFLVSLGAYLVARGSRDRWDWALAGVAAVFLVTLAATFDLVVAGVSLDFVGVALGGPLVAGAWLLRRRSRVGFEGVLVVAGAGLVVLVEYVYLADNASPERFNTVFKVYAQAWALWSVAAGVALASLARRGVGSNARLRSAAGTALVAVLLVSASVYGGLALTNHFGQMDDPTLDAMEYVHDERPGEAAAIEWLLDRPGQPHLVSAPGLTPYSWQNPEASLTGIPTVAGWIQETIYRGDEAYYTRVSDVDILFETEDPVSRAVLLRKHEVDYIWVGPVEQERYEVANMVDEPGISVATVTTTVTVYAVNRTELVETQN